MTAETAQAIAEKTIILSSRYGFDRVSYKEIAFEVGLPEETLAGLYPMREDLLDAVLEYIGGVIEHYNPGAEDIEEMLRDNSPTEILHRFVTAYRLKDNTMTRSIYRFIIMEQARSERIRKFSLDNIVLPPSRNCAFAADVLVAHGAIPPCDSHVIAEMWNRTSLLFEMLAAHGLRNDEDYFAMTRFYIDLYVRGVRPVPHSAIDTQWKPRPHYAELLARSDSPKQRVMLTALDLFGEHGYRDVSMSQIAQACGLSLIATYRTYRSKSDIMQDIVALLLNTDRLVEDPVFTAAWRTSDEENITLTLADSYSNSEDELVRKLYRILFREQFYNEDFKDFLVGSLYRDIESIRQSLTDLVAQNRIPPCDAKRIAIAFVFTMCSYSIDATLSVSDNPPSRLAVIALLISLILNGFVCDERGRTAK